MNYEIDKKKHTFSYWHGINTITIGSFSFNNFTDSEITEYVSDCLTHEHIHKALDHQFGRITSKLFDGIEYLFRNDEIHVKHLEGTNRFTYQEFINKHGYATFLKYIGLNKHDILLSNIACNGRG